MNRGIWLLSLAVLLGVFSFFFDSYVASFAAAIQNPSAIYVMSWFSHLATMVVVLLVMSSLFLFEERKVRRIKVVWLSFAAAFFVSAAIKMLVERMRPSEYLTTEFFVYSFPSMHTAIAFALLPILDKEFPRLKWFWLAFALFIAASRIYLKAHYFSDVFWGGLIGYLIGKGAIWLQENRMLEWLSWKKIHWK